MVIESHAPPQSKSAVAREMNVSRSSLYYKKKLPEKDLVLKSRIEKVMSTHKAYGHRRIAWELGVNKKKVLRVMKIFGLKPKRRRKKKPEKPQDTGAMPMPIPNLLVGLAITAPNQVWVTDFTYLPYFGRFVYLATIEDVFTRQIIGWQLSVRHNAELVFEALLDALSRNKKPGIVHSDQGSEYRSDLFLKFLEAEKIAPSMSEKASPWQNGYKESFYSGFKLEFGHPENYPTVGELIEAIAQQIFYYNNKRIHSALKCPPAVFAKRLEIANVNNFLNIQKIENTLSV